MTNLISWVEIPATDFERAVNFYSSVLKTDLQTIDCGDEKMACFPGGEGAVSFAPGFKPGKDGLLVSFNAEKDIEGAIERIEENGGTIVQQKTKIEAEGRGYFALFIDSEGNRVGLYGDE
jgi:predicted enzyme related to lactoylglutathione lyase